MTQQRMVAHTALTSAHAERAAHLLDAPLLCFDLDDELTQLRAERPYVDGDRNAKTLVKAAAFRLVLVALKAGARFDEDDPRGEVSVLVRRGRVSLQVGGESTDVGPGQVAAIQAGNHWSAVAAEDSLVILTINWPPEP